jgi:hypothetical protein
VQEKIEGKRRDNSICRDPSADARETLVGVNEIKNAIEWSVDGHPLDS